MAWLSTARIAGRTLLVAVVVTLLGWGGGVNSVASGASDTSRSVKAHNGDLLDDLFAQLSSATSEAKAREAERQIWSAWLDSGDPIINDLMAMVTKSMGAYRYSDALITLNRIVAQAPNYAEGWNKRATVLYIIDEYDRSDDDIDKVLALEPRHFGALSGRALIKLIQGDKKHALESILEAAKVHPYLRGIGEIIRRAGGDGNEQQL